MGGINKLLSFLILYGILSFSSFAKEGLPVIRNYSVESYHAGIENWDAVQSDRGLMYFANSEGILEYDGVHWRLIETNYHGIIRSICKSPKGIVYAGGDHDLGYLAPDEYGQLHFKSLEAKCPTEHRSHLKHIWKVLFFDSKLFVLASGTILIFDEQHRFIKALDEKVYLRTLFEIDGNLMLYSNENGFKLFDKKTLQFQTYLATPNILHRSIEVMTSHPQGGIRYHIFGEGFYWTTGNTTKLEKKYPSESIDSDYLFCRANSGNQLWVGTTTKGLYTLNADNLDLLFQLEISSGLNDNKVFSIYPDANGNIWVCHENGLSYVEINTPVRLLNAKSGLEGSGFCTMDYQTSLFAGTSHGLYQAINKGNGFYQFQLFQQIRQPVYFLEKKEKSLLIGCLHELMEYDGKTLRVVAPIKLNRKIVKIPGDKPFYIVSTNEGLALIEYQNGFHFRHRISGFPIEIEDFNFTPEGKLIIIDNQYRLITATLSEDLKSLTGLLIRTEVNGTPLKFNCISLYNNSILLGTANGLYRFNTKGEIIPELKVNTTDNYSSSWMFNQHNNILWFERAILKNGKLKYSIDALSNSGKINVDNMNSLVRGNKAFGFGQLSSNLMVVGTSMGFLIYNREFQGTGDTLSKSNIRQVFLSGGNDTTWAMGIWQKEEKVFPYVQDGDITQVELTCAANFFYSTDKIQYTYRIREHNESWHPWSTDNIIRFRLAHDGKYTVDIMATDNFREMSQISTVVIDVKNPWYRTLWWYGLEIFLMALIMMISIYFNRKGNSRISKVSAFMIVLIILSVFEIGSEIIQDWIDAQGETIFAFRIAINILLALSIDPIEKWLQKKLIHEVPEEVEVSEYVK
ncbi:MAG: two-component regulator propeller domain-containing protein [Cytophagaceae bacterium]